MTRKERQAINKAEYNKQLNRIKSYISYHEKKGEIVNINLPQRPKSYTKKEIDKLKRITRQKLKKSLVTFNPETGEITPVTKKLASKPNIKKTKKQTTPKISHPTYTDTPLMGLDLSRTIIDNVKDEIMKFPSKPCERLLEILVNIEDKRGSEVLADILMDCGTFLETLQRVNQLYKATEEYTTTIYKHLGLERNVVLDLSSELEENTSWE